jgi:CAAX prenyl protease-like protein
MTLSALRSVFARSPVLSRVLPFGVFAGLTLFQGELGAGSQFWIYVLKTIVGAILLWLTWPFVKEMRWQFSWLAVLTGVGVFAMWVGLDGLYPRLDVLLAHVGFGAPAPPGGGWNPHAFFGTGTTLAWTVIAVRLIGSSIVVPPLEEVFYRSFLYRSFAAHDFEREPVGRFVLSPFLITSVVFGISHHEWLAGILCGFAYQGLVCWTKRLGDAMTAHAVTNALLGGWVAATGAWHFW